MAIDIPDSDFMGWLRDLDQDTRIDLEVFWAREVKRHPFLKANPETADAMARRMILLYAADNHGYELRRGHL